MKKKLLSLLTASMLAAALFAGCGESGADTAEDATTSEETTQEAAVSEDKPAGSVTILYTNDTHGYLNNTTDQGLTFANIKAMKDDLEAEGQNVILVDAGDIIQGAAYASFDEGATAIELMNMAGYQVSTPGNHEFDYGSQRFFSAMEEADFPFVSCNFYDVQTGELVLEPYTVIEAGDVKVAFVGITTPETLTKASPATFQDDITGEQLYSFYAGDDGQELYDAVQSAIDAASAEADYVIGLAHLGDNTDAEPYDSATVIEHITGLDAMIDSHSHTVNECDYITDASGKEVLRTQTGSYLHNVGQMTIEDGQVRTELISEYSNIDATIAEKIADTAEAMDVALGKDIAYLDCELYYNAPDTASRMVRSQECNLGDLVADAYYYELTALYPFDVDAAIINGGSLRTGLETGTISRIETLSELPFTNNMTVIEATGQQLLDALEMGACGIGEGESNGFLHVAGIHYTIDTSIESTVQIDDAGAWTGAPTGDYRVKDVTIYDKESGEYVPLDLEKTYRIGGTDYLLIYFGDGMSMFDGATVIATQLTTDEQALVSYVTAFAAGDDGLPHVNSAASPLAELKGYGIEYENPYGAGRITIE